MYCNTLKDDELEMASKAPYYYSEIIPKPNVTSDNEKSNGAKTDHYDKNHGFDNPLLSIEPDVSTGDTTESSFGFQKKKKKKKKNTPVTVYHRSNSLIQNGVHMFPSACYGRSEGVSSGDTSSSMPRKSTGLQHRRRSSEPNIYEEIPEVELVDDFVCYSGSIKGFPLTQKNQTNKKDNDRSPGGYSSKVVLDEVAKVQKRHAQILENLNLDVEAMLMPEDTPCPEELLPEKEVSKSNDHSANSESKSTHILSPGTPPLYFATSRWQGGSTLSKSETASLGRRVMNEYILQQSDFCPNVGSPSSKVQVPEVQKAAHQRFSDPTCAGRPCDEPLYMLYDDSHRQRASSRASVGFQSPEDNIYEEVDLQQLCRPDDDFEDSVSWFGSEAGADHSASSASEEMEEETGAAKLAAYIIGKKKKSKKSREQEGSGGGFTRWFSTRKKEYDLDKSSHRSSSRAQDDEGYVDVKISKKQRPPLSLPPVPSSLTPEKMKRRYIVGTIVDSENSYINALQRLIRDYKHPLEDSNPPIVSPNKISIMFHRVEQILQCHNIFGIALTQCVKQWDQDEKIGDVFVASFSKAMVLDIYSDFINNFSLAMETAKQASKNKSAFADFLKVKQITSADRLSFFGLMVKPVQRFPQFILLLQDLLKHTPPGHHDRMSLQLALTQLESLAETLNERKRESEQHHAVKEVLKHIGKFSLKSFADKDHYLLRQDDIVQLQLDQNGLVVKSKNRRIFLLNGLLVSVSVTPRTNDGIQNGERLTLKWAVPLQHVEVQKDVAPATRNLLASSGRSRMSGSKSTERPSVADGGSVQTLYDELSDLVHDLEVMSRISALVSSLRCSYSGLSTEFIQGLSHSIQESIRQKDKEITLLDSCCLQLAVPLKSRSNKEALCFQMANPGVKRDWTTDFRLAKLALDPNNTPAWDIPDQEKRPSSKMPLFVKTFPVFQCASAAEVKCGCYYMVCSGSLQHPQHYLWLCSSDGINSHVVVMTIHLTHLCQVAAYHLNEMRILAMEAVPGVQSNEGCVSTPDVSEEVSRPSDAAETVWLGTDSRKILVLEGSCPEKWEEIGTTTVAASVIQIKYHWEQVFVALANGSVNIFQRDTDGRWKLADPVVVTLDQEPVTCLLPLGLSMYCACGTKIWVLDSLTTEIQKSYAVQHESEGHAYLLAHSGTGLWISLRNSATICLYHTETFRHLQDINVASNVNRLLAAKQQERSPRTISVTCLLATRGLLWVGTNVGIVLTVPLPRLEGVPIISGRTNGAYHGHYGQVSLLLNLQLRPVVSAIPTSASRDDDSCTDQEGELSKTRVVKQKSDSMLPSPASVKESHGFGPRASAADIHVSGAKTLPRSMTFCPHTHPHNTMEDSSDVYGLYSDLMNVQNYEEDSREKLYERLNHSDPELVHFHLTTLDRRLQQKTGRPRSWDLSAMAVSEDSDSSAAYDSASTATSTATADTSVPSPDTCVNTEIGQPTTQPLIETSQSQTQVTLSRTAFKPSRKSPFDSSQKTVLMLTGGCSYMNWRKSEKEKDLTTSNDAHVIIWEMKL